MAGGVVLIFSSVLSVLCQGQVHWRNLYTASLISYFCRLLNVLPRSGALEAQHSFMSAPITMNGALMRYSLLGYGHAGEAHELSLPSCIFIITGTLKKLTSSPFMVMGVLMMSFSNAPELVGMLQCSLYGYRQAGG
jgi:hypothetical protein